VSKIPVDSGSEVGAVGASSVSPGLSDLEGFGRVVDLPRGEFRDMEQPLETGFDLDEGAEVRDLGHATRDGRIGLVLRGDLPLPGILPVSTPGPPRCGGIRKL
jgi:hypothetical protein